MKNERMKEESLPVGNPRLFSILFSLPFIESSEMKGERIFFFISSHLFQIEEEKKEKNERELEG